MGWPPRELDLVTLWEFSAAWEGYKDFHTVPDEEGPPPEMSDERLAELGIVGFS